MLGWSWIPLLRRYGCGECRCDFVGRCRHRSRSAPRTSAGALLCAACAGSGGRFHACLCFFSRNSCPKSNYQSTNDSNRGIQARHGLALTLARMPNWLGSGALTRPTPILAIYRCIRWRWRVWQLPCGAAVSAEASAMVYDTHFCLRAF